MPFVDISASGGAIDHYNFSSFTGLMFWDLRPNDARSDGQDDVVLLRPGASRKILIYQGWNAGLYKITIIDRPGFRKLLGEVQLRNINSAQEAQDRAPLFKIDSTAEDFAPGMPGMQRATLDLYRPERKKAVYTCEQTFPTPNDTGVRDAFLALEWNGEVPIHLDWITPYFDNRKLT